MAKPNDFNVQLKKVSNIIILGPMKSTPMIDRDDLVIAIDGGVLNIPSHLESTSFLSIGDGDSSRAELDINLPPQKDRSDLFHCLELLPENIESITAYGFTGGRLDHELFVLGEIAHFLATRTKITQIHLPESKVRAFSQGPTNITATGTFSIFTLEAQEITIKGECEYQITTPTELAPLSSHGLSNKAEGKITIGHSAPLFFYEVADRSDGQDIDV